jgi:type II secretory pathway pseudopilin PulG
MLTPRSHRIPRHLCEERGTTLIELLVGMVAGSAVCLALVALLLFATHQQARLSAAVQTNQLSRTAMTKIVDELHSACIAQEFTPIVEKSSENELRFVNAYSAAAVISEAKSEAYEQRIAWNEATGKLIDTTFASNGGSWPHFTFPKSPSEAIVPGGTLLASNVTKNTVGGKSVPIFQYYPYTTTVTSGTETALTTLSSEALKVPLTSTEAARAAAVVISFKTAVGVKGKEEAHAGGRTDELSDQVTLAFSAPKSESTSVDGPCQ